MALRAPGNNGVRIGHVENPRNSGAFQPQNQPPYHTDLFLVVENTAMGPPDA